MSSGSIANRAGTLRVIDGRSGAVLADRVRLCDSMLSRFLGLMLRASLGAGEGIILSPCGSVHMALMRFSIDVLYLDRTGHADKLVEGLRPYCISFGGRSARHAVELPAGTLARAGVQQGNPIEIRDEDGNRVTL